MFVTYNVLHQNGCTSWVFILCFNNMLLNQVFCFWYIWYTSSKRYHFPYLHKLRNTMCVTYNVLHQNRCTSWVFILFFNDMLLNPIFIFYKHDILHQRDTIFPIYTNGGMPFLFHTMYFIKTGVPHGCSFYFSTICC
jgi:hypothetical protein